VDLNDFHDANASFTLSCDVQNLTEDFSYSNAARNFFTFGYHIRGRNVGEVTVGTDVNSSVPVIGVIDALDTKKAAPIDTASTINVYDDAVHNLTLVYNNLAHGESKMMLFDGSNLVCTASNLSTYDFGIPDRKLFFGTSAWTNEASWSNKFDYANVKIENIKFTTNDAHYPVDDLATINDVWGWGVNGFTLERESAGTDTISVNNICTGGSVLICTFNSDFPVLTDHIKVSMVDVGGTNSNLFVYSNDTSGSSPNYDHNYIFVGTVPDTFASGPMTINIQFGNNSPIVIDQNSFNMYVDNTPPTSFTFTLDSSTSSSFTLKYKVVDLVDDYLSAGYSLDDYGSHYKVKFYTSNDTNDDFNRESMESDFDQTTTVHNNEKYVDITDLQTNVEYYIKADVIDIVGNSNTFNLQGGVRMTRDEDPPDLSIDEVIISESNIPTFTLTGNVGDSQSDFDLYALVTNSNYSIEQSSSDIKNLMLDNSNLTKLNSSALSGLSNSFNSNLSVYYDVTGTEFYDFKTNEYYYIYMMAIEDNAQSNSTIIKYHNGSSAAVKFNQALTFSNISVVDGIGNVATGDNNVELEWTTLYKEYVDRFNTTFATHNDVVYSSNPDQTEWKAKYTVPNTISTGELTYSVKINETPYLTQGDAHGSNIYIQQELNLNNSGMNISLEDSPLGIRLKGSTTHPNLLKDTLEPSESNNPAIWLGYPFTLEASVSNATYSDSNIHTGITYCNDERKFYNHGTEFDSNINFVNLSEGTDYEVVFKVTDIMLHNSNITSQETTLSNLPNISNFTQQSVSMSGSGQMSIGIVDNGNSVSDIQVSDVSSTFSVYMAVFNFDTATDTALSIFYNAGKGSNLTPSGILAGMPFDIPSTISFDKYYRSLDSSVTETLMVPSQSNYYLNLFVVDAVGNISQSSVPCVFDVAGHHNLTISSDNNNNQFATKNDNLTFTWETKYVSVAEDFIGTILGDPIENDDIRNVDNTGSNWKIDKQVPADFTSNGYAEYDIKYVNTHPISLSSSSANIYIDVDDPIIQYTVKTETEHRIGKFVFDIQSINESNPISTNNTYTDYIITFTASNGTHVASNVLNTHSDIHNQISSVTNTVTINNLNENTVYNLSATVTDPAGNTTSNIFPNGSLNGMFSTTDTTPPTVSFDNGGVSVNNGNFFPTFDIIGSADDDSEIKVYAFASDLDINTQQNNSDEFNNIVETYSTFTEIPNSSFTNSNFTFSTSNYYNSNSAGVSFEPIKTETDYYFYIVSVEQSGQSNVSVTSYGSSLAVHQEINSISFASSNENNTNLATSNDSVYMTFTTVKHEGDSNNFIISFSGDDNIVYERLDGDSGSNWRVTYVVPYTLADGQLLYSLSLHNDVPYSFNSKTNEFTGVYIQNNVQLSNATDFVSTINETDITLRNLNDIIAPTSDFNPSIYIGDDFDIIVSASEDGTNVLSSTFSNVIYDSNDGTFTNNSITITGLTENTNYDISMTVTNLLNQSSTITHENIKTTSTPPNITTDGTTGTNGITVVPSESGNLEITLNGGSVIDVHSDFSVYAGLFDSNLIADWGTSDNDTILTNLQTAFTSNNLGSNIISNGIANASSDISVTTFTTYIDSIDSQNNLELDGSYFLYIYALDVNNGHSFYKHDAVLEFTQQGDEFLNNIRITNSNENIYNYAKSGDILKLSWNTTYNAIASDFDVTFNVADQTITTGSITGTGNTWEVTCTAPDTTTDTTIDQFIDFTITYNGSDYTSTDLVSSNVYIDNSLPTFSYSVHDYSPNGDFIELQIDNISESNQQDGDANATYDGYKIEFTADPLKNGITSSSNSLTNHEQINAPTNVILNNLSPGEYYTITASITDPAGNITDNIGLTGYGNTPVKTVDTSNPVFINEIEVGNSPDQSSVTFSDIQVYDAHNSFNFYAVAFKDFTFPSTDQEKDDFVVSISNVAADTTNTTIYYSNDIDNSNDSQAVANKINFTLSNYFEDSNMALSNQMVSGDTYKVVYLAYDNERRDGGSNNYTFGNNNTPYDISLIPIPTDSVDVTFDKSGVTGGLISQYNFLSYDVSHGAYVNDGVGIIDGQIIPMGSIAFEAEPGWVDGYAATFNNNSDASCIELQGSPLHSDNLGGTTSSSFSISTWFKPSAQPSSDQFLFYESDTRYVKLNNNNNIIVSWIDNYNSAYTFTTSSPVKIGEWNHLVVNFKPAATTGKIELYLNNPDSSITSPLVTAVNANGSQNQRLRIGNNAAKDAGFDGSMDDIRFYKGALSQADVGKLYAIGGNVLEYTFDNLTVTEPNSNQFEFFVSVVNTSGEDKFHINGLETPFVSAKPDSGKIYVFNQDGATNNGHPLYLSTFQTFTSVGGNVFPTDVEYYLDNSNVGDFTTYSNDFDNATTRRLEYTVHDQAQGNLTLYYHCGSHLDMGSNGMFVVDSNVEFEVKVFNDGTNKFSFDGKDQYNLILHPECTYTFNQSDTTNGDPSASQHPLFLQTDIDGIHYMSYTLDSSSGVTYNIDDTDTTPQEYDANFTTATSREVKYTVPIDTELTTLYYVCGNHNYMGGTIKIAQVYSETTFNDNNYKNLGADVLGNVSLDTTNPVIGKSAAAFDGNSYIRHDTIESVGVKAGKSTTVSFWYYPPTPQDPPATDENALIGLRNADDNTSMKLSVTSGSELQIDVDTTPNTPHTSSAFTNMNSDDWNHIAFVYNSGTTQDTVDFYLNGVKLDNSSSFSTISEATNPFDTLFIGTTDPDTPDAMAKAGTMIDDFKIYNRALLQDEITTLFEERFNSGMLLRYDFERLDETQNAGQSASYTVYDESGHAHDGVVHNIADLATTFGDNDGAIAPKSGDKYFVPQTDEYIEIAGASNIGGSNLSTSTFAAWVNVDAANSNQFLPVVHKEGVFSFGLHHGTAKLLMGDGGDFEALPSLVPTAPLPLDLDEAAVPVPVGVFGFNSNVADSTVNARDGTLPPTFAEAKYVPGVVPHAGQSNYAINFGGSDEEYIDLGTDILSSDAASSTMTLSAWVKGTEADFTKTDSNIHPILARNEMFTFGLSNGIPFLDLYVPAPPPMPDPLDTYSDSKVVHIDAIAYNNNSSTGRFVYDDQREPSGTTTHILASSYLNGLPVFQVNAGSPNLAMYKSRSGEMFYNSNMTIFAVYVHDVYFNQYGSSSFNYLINHPHVGGGVFGDGKSFDIASGNQFRTTINRKINVFGNSINDAPTNVSADDLYTPKLMAFRYTYDDTNNYEQTLNAWFDSVSSSPSSSTSKNFDEISQPNFNPTNIPAGSFNIAGGKPGYGTTGFKGQIAEIIVMKEALSDEEIAAVLTNLDTKWGLGFGPL
jgi:hypothetical protein